MMTLPHDDVFINLNQIKDQSDQLPFTRTGFQAQITVQQTGKQPADCHVASINRNSLQSVRK
jgi:hypothetical protein